MTTWTVGTLYITLPPPPPPNNAHPVTRYYINTLSSSLHVPEEHAELPNGHRLFEHGHGTVAFHATQKVHCVLFDLMLDNCAATAAAATHRRCASSARCPRRFRRRPDI